MAAIHITNIHQDISQEELFDQLDQHFPGFFVITGGTEVALVTVPYDTKATCLVVICLVI